MVLLIWGYYTIIYSSTFGQNYIFKVILNDSMQVEDNWYTKHRVYYLFN